MTKFIEDSHGDLWPITGDYCRICGWPLIKVTTTQTAHPTCASRDRKESEQ